MQRVQGFVEQGDTSVLTMGHTSTNVVQGSYPYATVTVYLAGTTSLATLYSDNHTTPTPLANPFTADENGYWFFYAVNGRYDVRFSGVDIACPWTFGDIMLDDPSADAGAPVTSVFNRIGAIVAVAGDYAANQITVSPAVSGWATVQVAIEGLNSGLSSVTTGPVDWSRIVNAPTFANNPTTTLGDLIVRGATALQRLGVGTDGQVLIANSSAPNGLGMAWQSPAAVSVPVTSVFTRIGDIVAAAGDYAANQITVSPAVSGWANVQVAIEGLNSGLTTGSIDWSRIVNVPPLGVAIQSNGSLVGSQPTINFVDTASASVSVTNDTANNRMTLSIAATGAGYLPDPTTTLGDLIVRGPGLQVQRFAVGSNGQVLTARDTAPLGVAWEPVAATPNATQVNLSPSIGGWITVQDAVGGLNTAVTTGNVDWSRIINAPTFTTSPGGSNGQIQYNDSGVFGGMDLNASNVVLSPNLGTYTNVQVALAGIIADIGNIVGGAGAAAGSPGEVQFNSSNILGASPGFTYNVSTGNLDIAGAYLVGGSPLQIAWTNITGVPTNFVTTDGSYPDPPWITSLAWSKIQGAPAFVETGGSYYNPSWITGIAWSTLNGVPTNFVTTDGSYTDPTWLTINWSKLNGNPTPAQVAYMQTPWLQNIDGATFNLANVNNVGIRTTSPSAPLTVVHSTANATTSNFAVSIQGTWGGGLSLVDTAANLHADFYTTNLGAGEVCIGVAATGTAVPQTLSIGANGRVGINNTAPSFTLDITGDSRVYNGDMIIQSPTRGYHFDVEHRGGKYAPFEGALMVISDEPTLPDNRCYFTPEGRFYSVTETNIPGFTASTSGLDLGYISISSNHWGKPGYVIINDANASFYLWMGGSDLDIAVDPTGLDPPGFSNNVSFMSSQAMVFHVNTTPPISGECMRIAPTGNIGMGKGGTMKNPQYQLEIFGSINIRDPAPGVNNFGIYINDVKVL